MNIKCTIVMLALLAAGASNGGANSILPTYTPPPAHDWSIHTRWGDWGLVGMPPLTRLNLFADPALPVEPVTVPGYTVVVLGRYRLVIHAPIHVVTVMLLLLPAAVCLFWSQWPGRRRTGSLPPGDETIPDPPH